VVLGIAGRRMKQCNNCGRDSVMTATFCRFCGSTDWGGVGGKNCPKCNRVNAGDSVYCTYCGAGMDGQREKTRDSDQIVNAIAGAAWARSGAKGYYAVKFAADPKKELREWIIALIVVGPIFLAIFVWAITYKPPHDGVRDDVSAVSEPTAVPTFDVNAAKRVLKWEHDHPREAFPPDY
jgi:uncharacterized membrane protein YvbJ